MDPLTTAARRRVADAGYAQLRSRRYGLRACPAPGLSLAEAVDAARARCAFVADVPLSLPRA